MAFDAALALSIGLTRAETGVFRRLNTPEKIQDFLTGIPINFEPQGDTCQSAALLLHGQPALLMDFQAHGDDDHVLALFRLGKHWGAISKSNSIWLRWRDPVYASPRELAMSYFHEYVNEKHKTLRRISKPFDIGRYDPGYWLTSQENCWAMAQEIDASPHVDLISKAQARRLKLRDSLETRAGDFKEFSR
jgi:hypothetical protein